MIAYTCPGCGRTTQVNPAMAGKTAKCPCGAKGVVAGKAAPVAAKAPLPPPQRPPTDEPRWDSTTGETIYLRDGCVTVTSARVMLPGRTYSLAHVTSVAAREIPGNHALPMFFFLASCPFLIIGWSGADMPIGPRLAMAGIGVAGAIAAVVWFINVRSTFAVRIGTASGEADALRSIDQHTIGRVVGAVNRAIVERAAPPA
jgi:hypothetical protein